MDCYCIRLGIGSSHGGICRRQYQRRPLESGFNDILALEGSFWKDVPVYIAGQMIGAMIGAVVVYLHYLPH